MSNEDTQFSTVNQPSKPRGGPRPGSGRKPTEVNAARKCMAMGALSPAQEKALWKRLLNSTDNNIALKAFSMWLDRVHGKVKSEVEVTGTPTAVTSINLNI
jgi:hypothetical protein